MIRVLSHTVCWEIDRVVRHLVVRSHWNWRRRRSCLGLRRGDGELLLFLVLSHLQIVDALSRKLGLIDLPGLHRILLVHLGKINGIFRSKNVIPVLSCCLSGLLSIFILRILANNNRFLLFADESD